MKIYLLDTNIILYSLRSTDFHAKIVSDFALYNAPNVSAISVVTLGELQSIALKNHWGEKRISQMKEFLKNFLVIDIHQEDLINAYALIDAFSQNRLTDRPLGETPRNMGKNDLWIAATASVTTAILLTTDADFNHLDTSFLEIKNILV